MKLPCLHQTGTAAAACRRAVLLARSWLLAGGVAFTGTAALRADTLLATQTYTTPGTYTYTLPANTYRVVVKTWGAGGNRSNGWEYEGAAIGGTGGFVVATYAATASTVVNIRVGAAPGGASGAYVTSGFQVISAGGGSAGEPDPSDGHGGSGGSGGATGESGGETGGGGATGSAGGAGGINEQSDSGSAGTGPLSLSSYAANGGAPHTSGGGAGGSGYYGGGGGVRHAENDASGGGGGGSNFMDTGNGYVSSSGTSTTGGTGDSHYSTSLKYGQGADGSSSTPGNGAVVILAYAANQAPVASFTATPTTGRAPLAVSFNGSGSYDPGPGGGITAYAWDFDNNGSTDATGSTASNTYQNTGTTLQSITAKLIVTDNDSSAATANATQTINVYPASSKALTVQYGTITSTVLPYYQPGEVLSLSANPPATALFVQWIVVSGAGTFANATSATTTFTLGSSDTVIRASRGPTVPGSFASPSSTATAINLSWTASTDDIAVTGYDLYRVKGGVTLLATTLAGSATSFSDTHVQPGTSYGYFLRARDGDGNVSNATSTVTVTTPALTDTDADSLPDAFETLFGTTANANPSGETSLNLKLHRPN